eukprot:CAMPEP_0181313458 /NCGR_PEP_ID=MMETSP1101-20121128/14257_1 /TAXON_ID=46948 /ORGANISM="Rhodomonas abbreviata, Strain Caron Lab Isolate" /LENGTH=1511 /DNA_ID=CAMNT_0023420409 /DNA_START=376 /DNA_END=4908 /DNA_ORIENTATION=+
MWRNDAIRNAKAAGAGYVLKMIDKIDMVDDRLPRLVDQSKDDDTESAEFKKHAVNLAIQCGKEYSRSDPMSDDNIKKSFNRLELDIQSFGAQISAAAPKDRKHIFNQTDSMEYPLSPILEWHALYRSFDPHKGKDPTKYREALNSALAEELSLEPTWIVGWISRISNARTDLTKCEDKDSVDGTIIGTVINKFVDTTDTSASSTKWQIKANQWHEKYLEDKTSISWMALKQSVLAAADTNTPKKRTKDDEHDRAPRPKLNPNMPAGVAMAAQEREGIYQEAFHAAMAAIRSEGLNRESRSCYNCRQIGHISRFCTAPRQGGGYQQGETYQQPPRQSRWERVGGLRGGGGGGRAPYLGRGQSMPAMGDANPGGGREMFGEAGSGGNRGGTGRGTAGRGMSMDGRMSNFGRGIPSQSLTSIVGQAQTGMQGVEGPQFADAPDFDTTHTFPAFIPGDHNCDHDSQFREQVFGNGFGYDPSRHLVSLPPWADPCETAGSQDDADIAVDIPPQESVFARPQLRLPMSDIITKCVQVLTFLPITLELLINNARRFVPTHLPRTPCAALGITLLIITILSVLPTTTAHNAAFVNFSLNSSTLYNYLLDSGCTTSIISDTRFLSNFKRIPSTNVTGLGGNKTYNWTATLTLPLRTIHGVAHQLVVEGVFWDEQGTFNLVSGHQVEQAYRIVLDGEDSELQERNPQPHLVGHAHPVKLPVAKIGRLYLLPIFWKGAAPPPTPWQAALTSSPTEFSFHSNCGSMSLEELFHLRMAHTPVPRLAAMSRLVKGVPRCLHMNKVLRFPCGICQEAKAVRQPYPPASTHTSTHENDLITWDSFDMGNQHLSMGGNRYVSVFVIHRSRYAITVLHKDRKFDTMKKILIRAFARAGFTPKRVRHDGAGEYVSEELTAWLAEQGTHVWSEQSNPHEQFGNAISEKLVDTLGKGIRTLLLHSQLPPEFWGACALYYTDVYNHLPHASLNHEIPHTIHTGQQADVSWFRPFGCRATLFRGRDLVEHHKLAPRGEQGVFIGLGMTHGYKSWADTIASQLEDIEMSQEFHWTETMPEQQQTPASGGSPTTRSSGGGPTTRASGGNQAQPLSGGVPSAGNTSAGEFRPVKRHRFSEAPPAYGQQAEKWWQCENAEINSVSDKQLSEFLIGHSVKINFPTDFWPRDGGTWTGEAFDTGKDQKNFGERLCLRVLLLAGPKSRRFGEHAIIPMSHDGSTKTDVSIRRAIAKDFPFAVRCKDLTIDREGKANGNGIPKTVTRVTRSRSKQQSPHLAAAATTMPKPSGSAKILHSPDKCTMPALYAFAACTMLHSQQYENNYVCEIEPIVPKSEKEARACAHAEQWLTSEEIELKTIWKMGTFEIVDLPPGVIPLPSRFTYSIKRDQYGRIVKFKSRLVARGDMQYDDEYSTTYAPTSRFTAIRTIISIATQEKMELKHWDITGAFMTANIDTDIYMDMPPGYHLEPGKTVKLLKSLYGLRQSPGLFHDTLEEWLRGYGFKAVDDEGTIFKLTRGGES